MLRNPLGVRVWSAQVEEGDGGSDGGSDKSEVSFDLAESTKDILFTSSLNWLLLLIPVAVVAKNVGVGDGWLFVFSLLPICPLAGASQPRHRNPNSHTELDACSGRRSGQRARERPAGVPGLAWRFAGCRPRGSPT